MDAKVMLLKSKRSQVAIFIIIALIVIVSIIIIFLLINPIKIDVYDENNPQAYIESCARQSAEEAIAMISAHGGDIVPKGTVEYQGESIVYLCYNNEYYSKCIKQRPLLIEHIEEEITNYTIPRVKGCFDRLEGDLRKRYDNVETSNMILKTSLYPKQVVIEIDKKIKAGRDTNVREFNKFRMNLAHPIYNLAKISMEISNQEAQYCNFDDLGFMILNPQYDIVSTITGDADTIYVVKERATNQQFIFATKSCPLPPGF